MNTGCRSELDRAVPIDFLNGRFATRTIAHPSGRRIFIGVSRFMRLHVHGMTTAVRGFLSVAFAASAALISGCDSAPDVNSPEAKQQIAARNESIKAEEDRANAAAKKAGGKNAPKLKSIKNIQMPETK